MIPLKHLNGEQNISYFLFFWTHHHPHPLKYSENKNDTILYEVGMLLDIWIFDWLNKIKGFEYAVKWVSEGGGRGAVCYNFQHLSVGQHLSNQLEETENFWIWETRGNNLQSLLLFPSCEGGWQYYVFPKPGLPLYNQQHFLAGSFFHNHVWIINNIVSLT